MSGLSVFSLRHSGARFCASPESIAPALMFSAEPCHRGYGFRVCAKRRILRCAIAHRGMTNFEFDLRPLNAYSVACSHSAAPRQRVSRCWERKKPK